MNIKVISHIPAIIIACLLQSCGGNSSSDQPVSDTKGPGKELVKTGTLSTGNGGQVSFAINGTEALKANETDDVAGARLNAVNNQLSISMYGDVVKYTKRGMLNISCPDFNKRPGEIKNARASFTRYLDANGGKIAVYNSGKEDGFSLFLTHFEKLPDGPVGEEWLVSGIFSGRLKPALGYDQSATDKELVITNGKFEKLKLNVLGKK